MPPHVQAVELLNHSRGRWLNGITYSDTAGVTMSMLRQIMIIVAELTEWFQAPDPSRTRP